MAASIIWYSGDENGDEGRFEWWEETCIATAVCVTNKPSPGIARTHLALRSQLMSKDRITHSDSLMITSMHYLIIMTAPAFWTVSIRRTKYFMGNPQAKMASPACVCLPVVMLIVRTVSERKSDVFCQILYTISSSISTIFWNWAFRMRSYFPQTVRQCCLCKTDLRIIFL